jgi:hypothetical protein
VVLEHHRFGKSCCPASRLDVAPCSNTLPDMVAWARLLFLQMRAMNPVAREGRPARPLSDADSLNLF